MTFIQKQTGEIIDLDELGVRTRDFIISSPNITHHIESIDGGIGVIDYGQDVGARNITVKFRMQSRSIEGFSLKRDEIFNLFGGAEPFYLIEKRLTGRRWLVKVNGEFDIPQRVTFGNFDVDFIAINGYAESVGTTMDIHNNDIDAMENLWSAGMGLVADGINKNYIVQAENGKNFRIYNPGNVEVHPFFHDFHIEIKNVVHSALLKHFELHNRTNGSRIRINRIPASNQSINLIGANVLLNQLTNILKDTDKGVITLSPGWNSFVLVNADTAEIKFDFRTYYK